MMKKIFTLLFCTAVLMSCMTGCGKKEDESTVSTSSAEENAKAKDFSWTFEEGVLTLSGHGEMPEWVRSDDVPWDDVKAEISQVVIEDGLTSIGKYAFSECYQLTDASIPDSILIIEDCAFRSCEKLASVNIPENVIDIGGVAFKDTPWLQARREENPFVIVNGILIDGATCSGDVSIPDGVACIGEYAFSNAINVTNVIIPESVTAIGSSAFTGCNALSSVSIPESVTSIGGYAFYECYSLTGIRIPKNVTSIGGETFGYCASLSWVELPYGVVEIGGGAFSHCTSLESITIPDSVSEISSMAFKGCSGLKNVTLPQSLKKIYSETFYHCSSLSSIIIPDGVTSIGSKAFSDCENLLSITIPDSVTEIGDSAFKWIGESDQVKVYYTGSEEEWNAIAIEEGVDHGNDVLSEVEISFNAANNVLETGTCGDGVAYTIYNDGTAIVSGNGMMYGYSDTSKVFANSAVVTSIIIEDGVQNIGRWAFQGCVNLESITIGSGVEQIHDYSFYGCSGLQKITLPASVKSIGQGAFGGCNIAEVYYTGSESEWSNMEIGDSNASLLSAAIQYNSN